MAKIPSRMEVNIRTTFINKWGDPDEYEETFVLLDATLKQSRDITPVYGPVSSGGKVEKLVPSEEVHFTLTGRVVPGEKGPE